MEASKKAKEQLCNNTSITVSKKMKELRTELVFEESIENVTPKTPEYQNYVNLITISQGLKIGVLFSMIDIGSLLASELSATTPIEKRFLMKSAYASIAESYKLIYSFEKARKHSYLTKLRKMCPNEKKAKIEIIKVKLDNFEEKHKSDLLIRNVAYHYDDDMLAVYDKTIQISSEEDFVCTIKTYLDILYEIYSIVEEVQLICIPHVFVPTLQKLPQSRLINSWIHQEVVLEMTKRQMHTIIPSYIVSAAQTIDKVGRSMKKIKGLMEKNGLLDDEILKNVEGVYKMQNAFLIMLFYYVDLASIIMAYINSKNMVHPLNG